MTPPEPLSPRARSLLDAARDGLGPDDAAVARMRARVLAGTAGGVGVAAAVKASAWSLTGKLVAGAVFAAVLAGGTWLVVRDRTASGSAGSANAVPAAAPEKMLATGATPDVVAPSIASAPARSTQAALPPPENAAPIAPAPRRTPARAEPKLGLADEVALVDDAMAALRRDDASAALAAADEHVAHFGNRGQLAEEAAAIRVEALCRLGDARWSTAFDAFDAHYPHSAQRPRLSSACKGVQ